MFKRFTNYVFLISVYISGILIGGIYTPDVMQYAKQFNAFENSEQQEQLQQKPQKKPKTRILTSGVA